MYSNILKRGKIGNVELKNRVFKPAAQDFVGPARALYADPAWIRKLQEGRREDIKPCLRCNECMNTERYSTCSNLVCSVNPRLCKENELPITRTDNPKNIAVVGGGPKGRSLRGRLFMTLKGKN